MQPINSSGAHSGGEKNETRMRRRPIRKLFLSSNLPYVCALPPIHFNPRYFLLILFICTLVLFNDI